MSKYILLPVITLFFSFAAQAQSLEACGRTVSSMKQAEAGSTLEDVVKEYMDAGADIDICVSGDDTVVVGIFANKSEALVLKNLE